MKMSNCMVDLETLGTRAGCTIMSIGAVMFDPESRTLGAKFYVTINRKSCAAHGLHEDPKTLEWWGNQSHEARKIFDEVSSSNSWGLPTALNSFRHYLRDHGAERVKVWGNGADFDNAILQSAWAAAYPVNNVPPLWDHWDNRCYRTLKGLAPNCKMLRVGTYHHALDDAISQAHHAIDLFRELGLTKVVKPVSAWGRVKLAHHVLTGKLWE